MTTAVALFQMCPSAENTDKRKGVRYTTILIKQCAGQRFLFVVGHRRIVAEEAYKLKSRG